MPVVPAVVGVVGQVTAVPVQGHRALTGTDVAAVGQQQQTHIGDKLTPWESVAGVLWASPKSPKEDGVAVSQPRGEQSRADRVIVDARHVLPEEYDDEFTRADTEAEERAALCAAARPPRTSQIEPKKNSRDSSRNRSGH